MIINMTSGGVMPERILDAQTITPGTKNQIIEEGTYLRGSLTILGDADLIPAKLPKDVNLFGIQGTRPPNYGANVWGMSHYIGESVVTNPSFTMVLSNNTAVLKNFSCDVNRIADDWVNFFAGFSAGGNGSMMPFTLNGSTLQFSYWSDTDKVNVTSFKVNSDGTASMTFSGSVYATATQTMKYNGSKILPATLGETIAFIVDDDASAYPDGAIHTDGYYYKLLGAASSANVMSLSDGAIATVQQDYRDQIETEVSNA